MISYEEVKTRFDAFEKKEAGKVNAKEAVKFLKTLGIKNLYEGKINNISQKILDKNLSIDPYLDFECFYKVYESIVSPLKQTKYELEKFVQIIHSQVKESDTADLELLDRGITSSLKLLFGEKQQYSNKILITARKVEKRYLKPEIQLIIKLLSKRSPQELQTHVETFVEMLLQILDEELGHEPVIHQIIKGLAISYKVMGQYLEITVKCEGKPEVEEFADYISTLLDELTKSKWLINFRLNIQSSTPFPEVINSQAKATLSSMLINNSLIEIDADANESFSVIKEILKTTTFFSSLQVDLKFMELSALALLVSEALDLELEFENIQFDKNEKLQNLSMLQEAGSLLMSMNLKDMIAEMGDEIHIAGKMGAYEGEVELNIPGLTSGFLNILQMTAEEDDD